MLSKGEIAQIHAASLRILQEVGVVFHSPAARDIFQRHGVRVDGSRVHPSPDQVADALATAPARFTLTARDPARSVIVGGGRPALAPGYGAPFVLDAAGRQRRAVMADYETFCKLVHTSPVVNVNGFLLVDPSDRPPASYHLDMLRAAITLSDKPFMGSPLSRQAALDAVAMARLVWGTLPGAVMVSVISTLAPLQFAEEMADSLIAFAGQGQASMIVGGGIMGTTAPAALPGLIATQVASVLAGILLSQLVRPGAPVVFGVGGSTMDMQTGTFTIGGPEFLRALTAGVQMAHHCGIPCRAGGGISDAFRPDFQAGQESALALQATVSAGADFVLHACGILGAYMAMNVEKFILDETTAEIVLAANAPLEVDERSLALEAIREVGPGGEFLTHESTFEACRHGFYRSPVIRHPSYTEWHKAGRAPVERAAAAEAARRLAAYRPPDMDPGVVRDLRGFVEGRR